MLETIAYWVFGIGLAFDLLGCIGLLRLPDVYNRAQAATKCVTLGTCFILLGTALFGAAGGDWGMFVKALICAGFVLLTSPVGAHAVCRGAYISGVPLAGDECIEVSDEKMAKSVSSSRQHKARESALASITKISLDKLFEQMREGEVKELRVILRADVQGTLEAFGKAIEQLSTAAIKVRVLHEGTGTITDSDVLLASASDAIIIGFNVRPAVKIKELAEKEVVDIRSYDVIYSALDDIKKAMTGMLEPTFEERVIGSAEVRETFHVPKVGTIAGCFVVDGKVERNAKARVLREGVVIYNGRIGSLRRFKDDAKEVTSGYECGIGIENFNDIKVGDTIEAYIEEEVAAKL